MIIVMGKSDRNGTSRIGELGDAILIEREGHGMEMMAWAAVYENRDLLEPVTSDFIFIHDTCKTIVHGIR